MLSFVLRGYELRLDLFTKCHGQKTQLVWGWGPTSSVTMAWTFDGCQISGPEEAPI